MVARWKGLDRRFDQRTAVEIDRAICVQRSYGTLLSAAYLFQRGISLNAALRILAIKKVRSLETYYQR